MFPSSSIVVSCVFVGLMIIVVWSDVTTRRLPNRLTLTVLFVGLASQLTAGPGALLQGAEGVLLGLVLGIPLLALGAIGGGDVKLVAASGAFLGPLQLMWALALAGALGLFLAIEEITRRKVALPVLWRARDLLVHLATLGRKGERPQAEGPGSVTVPYGVAIAAGAVLAWFVPSAAVLG